MFRTRFLFGACLSFLVLALPLMAQDLRAAELRAQLERGDAAGVLDHVRRALGDASATLGMYIVGAEAALALGQYPHARGMADLAVAKAPTNPEAYATVGHVLFALGEDSASRARGGGGLVRATFGDAAVAYANARRLGGAAYDLALWEAEARHMAGETDAALLALDAAEGARAGSANVARLRGTVLFDVGRHALAAVVLAQAVRLHPNDADFALLHLRVAMAGQDREAALAVFLSGVQRFPELPALYTTFIGAYEAERPDTWLHNALVKAAAAVGSGNETVLLWYQGALDEAAGRFSQALVRFEAYLQRRLGAPEGHFKVGSALLGLNRLDEARDQLLRAHAAGTLDPAAIAAALRGLVSALVGQQRHDAAASIQGVVAAMSHEPQDELNHGVVLYQSGRREDGVRVYRALAARDDVDPTLAARAWNYLGLALAGIGQSSDAEKAMRQSLEILPTQGDARENLAMLLLALGRRSEAKSESLAVLQLEPTRPRSLYASMCATRPWLQSSVR